MKPPWFQDLLPKSIRETTKTAKKINETRSQKKNAGFPFKTGHKKKKKEGFYIKPPEVSKKLSNFHFTGGNPPLSVQKDTSENWRQEAS